MKVILIKKVDDLGDKNEVKEVKNGFAKNFLIPKRLAKPATEKNLECLETQKRSRSRRSRRGVKKNSGGS